MCIKLKFPSPITLFILRNFDKIFKTSFSKNTCQCLLLSISSFSKNWNIVIDVAPIFNVFRLQLFFKWVFPSTYAYHTGYIEVIMQGKCGRNTETTFDIK